MHALLQLLDFRDLLVMSARTRITALALASLAASGPSLAQDDVSDARVREVHAAAKPVDAHVDVLMPTTPDIYRTDDGVSQVTIEKLEAGGMATVTLAIQAPTGPDTPDGIAAARAEIDAKLERVLGLAEAYPDRIEIAYGSADIERIQAEGRIAILIGFQNAYGLGEDLALVDHYVSRGVRVFAFNHAGNNAFSDSSRPALPGDTPHGGLSPIGRAAVERLNDAGVVIDVSQLTPDALMQTIAISRAPVIASHSAVRALVDETRNLYDYELDAIAAAGGVVHIPPFNTYVAPRPPEFVARLEALRRDYGLPAAFRGVLDDVGRLEGAGGGEYLGAALAAVPRAKLDDYLDHIDYVVERIGIDHVGIGTDFDHGAGIIDYRDASEAMNVTRALLERGYSPADIEKIWSGNFMRVLGRVEAAAALPPCPSEAGYDFVCGPRNAEDLVRIPGTRWVIASGMGGGASLYAVDVESRDWRAIYPGVAPAARHNMAVYGACPGSPDPGNFITHGLSLEARGDALATLYAVSHGDREAIEVFDVDARGSVPRLTWVGCVLMPEGLEANSVAVRHDGTIAATVLIEPGKSFADLIAGEPTGAVYTWTPGDESFERLRGAELPGNNGIEVAADGEEIFVVSSGLRTVVAFPFRNPTSPSRTSPRLPFIPDNVHMNDGGELLTAGMSDNEPACGGDFPGPEDFDIEAVAACPRGFVAAALDPATLEHTVIAEGRRLEAFSNATMALEIADEVWVGTFAGERIAIHARGD